MGRPRKNNDLPARVFFRHGRHYYVVNGTWTPLSRDKDAALAEAASLDTQYSPGWDVNLQRALEAVFKARRQNARARSIDFTVNLQDVIEMAKATKWRCAVSLIPFSLEPVPGKRRKPFAPSIDRIDSAKGYVAGNVRVVCLATNLAMNEWGMRS